MKVTICITSCSIKRPKKKYRVNQFPAASRLINDLMPLLTDAMKRTTLYATKAIPSGFSFYVEGGEILVSLLYHRQWVSNGFRC
ncbi:hypothetical protein O9992_08370 [Vibrio lentus]|nr:hypothetical protein [Vibrio lentus]